MSRGPIPTADPLADIESLRAALADFDRMAQAVDRAVVYGGERWPWVILGSSGQIFRIDTVQCYANGRIQLTCSPVLTTEDANP